MKEFQKIRRLLVQLDAIGPIEVSDGNKWYSYLSSTLTYESLTLLVATTKNYFQHTSMDISEAKSFRAYNDDTKDKLIPILKELKNLI